MKIELFATVHGGDNAGWYQRDVDWPAIPRTGETIIATDNWPGALTVDHVGYLYDGTPVVQTKPISAERPIVPTNLADHGWEKLPS